MASDHDTIAFYSQRGGTGRTTALANVAYALAETGANVGCVDLDLTAPDLHLTFPVGPVYHQSNQIHDYLRGEAERGPIEDFIIGVGERLNESPDGDLLLISGAVKPPGADNSYSQAEKVMELCDSFTDRRNLDYLLLDTVSGLSNHLVPVFDQADRILAFHRWTPRHKMGMAAVAQWIEDKPVTGGMEMLSVASVVPETVDESEIESWAEHELYQWSVSDHYIVNSSERLEGDDVLVTDSAPDTAVAEQYRGLAEQLTTDVGQPETDADTETEAETDGGSDEERNLSFVTEVNHLRDVLEDEYDEHWMDTVCISVTGVGQALKSDWETKFRRRNEEMFLAFLTELYFCPDRDTYEAEVKISDANAQFLLPPQRTVVDEVNEWDDEDFADTDARKEFLEQTVTDLADEPWGGEEVPVVVSEFRDRYNES